MHFYNKKRNNAKVIAAAIIFTLAIMVASSMAAPAAATATSATTTTTTTPPVPSSGIELSPEPVYQERQIDVSETPINQTHIQFTVSGNGTLTLPNGTETINTTSTGSLIASLDGTAAGKEVISTEDGSESATATFYGIARFSMEDDTGRGIIIAIIHTNSTGQLAPLDGMILAGQIEFLPDQTSLLTLWEWESGIPLPTSTSTAMEVPPQMNTTTTTTMTNATTADDSNATTAAPPEEEVVEEQQQQATPTIPAPLLE